MSDHRISRRKLIGQVAAGGAALVMPSELLAQRRRKKDEATSLGRFTHGVASGEPAADSMLFWTRYQGSGSAPVKLALEVATDPRMTKTRVMGETYADPARDWTARLTIQGLQPNTVYYYRWQGPEKNERSIIGRTKTLPNGQVPSFRIGVFACSNAAFGWFNAYAHAAAADDLDLFVHLGDYIYEYGAGTYPAAGQVVRAGMVPAGEAIRREDYWARYRSYRADADLQRLHANVPCVTIWDDHEVANDAWVGGAENHDPAREGDWVARKVAAMAAYRDWLPVSDQNWAKYVIGNLAVLYRLDTRLSGRDKPFNIAEVIRSGPDSLTALRRFRNQDWVAAHRQMLGERQENWLFAEMQAASRNGVRWQVLAQQVLMGRMVAPVGSAQWAAGGSQGVVDGFLGAAEMSARAGLPYNMDAWDGYPAARARVLSTAQRNNVDLIVLAGDTHNAWANNLTHAERPVGVEFAASSVTSPGIEAYLKGAPDGVAQALVGANPGLVWADTARRGYMHVTLTAAQAQCEWRFTESVASRSDRLAASVRGHVLAGQKRLQMG